MEAVDPLKGIIFNLLEQVVVARHGEETWDNLLGAAGADGAWTSLGNYPDETFMACVEAGAGLAGREPADFLRWFGSEALPLLAAAYPHFFEGHADSASFLRTLNDVVHSEVRKLYPGADVPDFELEGSDARRLVLGYRSHRRACALAEGFILGTARWYGESVAIEQPQCMLRGADRCLIACTFTREEVGGGGRARAAPHEARA